MQKQNTQLIAISDGTNQETGFAYRSLREYVYKTTPHGELRIAVHYPFDWRPGDRRPGILFFFGGALRQGTIEQFTRQATYLSSRGMVAARADYRVYGRHQVTADLCVQDAKSAMRWFRGHAQVLGVDADRIVASGGSAGGYLATCAAILEGFDAAGEDLSISTVPNALLLFNPALQRRTVDERFPTEEMAQRLSPIQHVSRDVLPTLMLFGTEDRLLPSARTFMDRAHGLGCQMELYLADGAAHAFFNRPPWFERTLYRADQFLAELGYIEGQPTFAPP
jgi:acetyl esterase/lipase